MKLRLQRLAERVMGLLNRSRIFPVVFVENGKVGNKIKVKVTEVADRFAKGTLV